MWVSHMFSVSDASVHVLLNCGYNNGNKSALSLVMVQCHSLVQNTVYSRI
jgi:hypothetical protein